MSEQLGALDKLIEAVEVGESATSPIFYDVLKRNSLHAISAFNGSLDAAMALHEALLPGWSWDCGSLSESASVFLPSYPGEDFDDDYFSAENADPARAWLLAILRAYRSTLTDTSNGGE